MNGNLRKLVSLTMTLILLLCMVQMSVGASYEVKNDDVIITTDSGEYIDVLLDSAKDDMLFSFFSFNRYTDSYGAQLDEFSKLIYDVFVDAYIENKGSGEIVIDFIPNVEFDAVVINGNWDSTDSAYLEVKEAVNNGVSLALYAFVYDYPEQFWFKGASHSYSISLSSKDGVDYLGEITETTFKPNEIYSGASSKIAAFDKAVADAKSFVKSQFSADSTRQEKLKIIHDYICNETNYGEPDNPAAHTAGALFLDECDVVCEGYAKAFKILCDDNGIPCACISGDAGGPHMWNYVQMEDGKWYLVDATWNDQENKIYDTYFLANKNTIGFDNVAISEERTEEKLENYFAYPVLSETEYVPHSHTYSEVVTAPTCNDGGYTTYTCACGHSYKADEKVKLGHTGGTANCKDKAVCTRCGKAYGEINADNHKSVITDSAVAATCKNTGLTEGSHCSACDTVIVAQITTAKLKHTYTSKITTPATHLKEGVKTFTCSGCGDKYTETVAKLEEHTYTPKVTAPTCNDDGYTTYTCACGHSYKADEKTKLGHAFSWVVDTDATCGKDGKKHEKCSRCSETRSLNTVIPATGNHSYTSEITTPATHLTEGVNTFTCSGCGDEYTESVEKLQEHTYVKTVTEPTCTTDGVATYTCACGKKYTETIESPGHSLTYKDAKAPTCSEPGYEAYEYCTVCTYTTYKEVSSTDHSLVYKDAKAPTCTEPGYEAYEYCTVCTYTTYKAVSATGHKHTSKVTTPATHLITGVMTYTCHCGDSYTDTIAKTSDHTYSVSGTIAADCTDKGYTTYICACGDSYKDNYVNALGHDYENGICKRCGDSKANNCSHMCHKNNFIWKILRFFFKLFKIQPVCECGVAHY